MGMENFEEDLREFIKKQTLDVLILTLSDFKRNNLWLPDSAKQSARFWDKKSYWAHNWQELGWDAKAVVVHSQVQKVIFKRKPEYRTQSGEKVGIISGTQQSLARYKEVPKTTTYSSQQYEVKNIFGIVTIIIGICSFSSIFTVIFLIVGFSMCFFGILVGLIGTLYDENKLYSLIGIALSLCSFILIIVLSIIFSILLAL